MSDCVRTHHYHMCSRSATCIGSSVLPIDRANVGGMSDEIYRFSPEACHFLLGLVSQIFPPIIDTQARKHHVSLTKLVGAPPATGTATGQVRDCTPTRHADVSGAAPEVPRTKRS
jgi:hypothetical protein